MDTLRSDLPPQGSLPGFDTPSDLFDLDGADEVRGHRKGYLLFFAIFPDAADAHRIAAAASDMRIGHGLNGSLLLPERLHLTLHAVASFSTLVPRFIVDAACAAARSVACAPLSVTFDRAMSFAGSKAFVLRSDAASDQGIAYLRHSLTVALRRAGLRPRASHTPHMTLLYDTRRIPEHGIEPMRWTATRYALILSHVGATHHQWVDQWPLDGRA
ncbi:hypothetical protein M8A51_01600 [Schlegelella sp. S2-27]|uniref:2'-5' RNA ligase n=1 Tax=Caldimonas mangrovi TaxID=2944811 RepID=A0ABT0YHM7_9BURK|nr:2'-5' RNA ligase family protein [Caldimonas mangrovi]MCM5678220.1 hypothetical protein [Caldimonas mangrovi]